MIRIESSFSSLSGFLLRHAVYRTQAENKIETWNSDNGVARKHIGKPGECDHVAHGIERWHQQGMVRNIKIRITRRKPLPVKIHRRRHGQRYDTQRMAVLVLHLVKECKIFL